jgi:hypothetical protein
MPRPQEESRATTAGKWLLAFVVLVSALALGSVMTEVLVVMSAFAAVACALLWTGPAGGAASRASRWVLVALALLLGMTVLQALPLPSAVTHWLTPANADSWDRALSPLREPGPAWHSLSLAPAATRVEVLRGFFYGCVFLGALRVAALEEGEAFLVRLVVFSTCVMAIGALAHTAVGAEKVFGVYRPRELYAYRAGHLAPLLNLNHLAAYLNIGTCVAIGALVDRQAMPRALAASAAVVLGGTSVWQGSRGAIGALLVGVVLTTALSLYTKRRVNASRAKAAVLAACAAAAAITVSISLSDVARERLLSRDLIKLEVAKMSVPLVTASPWFGVGRGAFESVFSSVREGAVYATFTHPENGVVQWFVEWGIPVSLAGAALLGWTLRPQIVLRAVHPAIGVWSAIIVAVLHDLVDFHLEVPGVVALVAVCVAIVVGARARSRRSSSARVGSKPSSSMRFAAVALVVGAGVGIVWVWRDVGHSLAEDRRTLSAMAVDKSMSPDEFRASVRDAMLRYPHEPFFPLMGAVRAQAADDGMVVAWVARALELSPRFGRAHFVLARSLAVGHAAQARLEYRLAFDNDVDLRDAILKESVRLVVDADSALELVPAGPTGADVLDGLATTIGDRLPSTAVMLDEELERRAPTTLGPVLRRVGATVADAANHEPWCDDRKCIIDGLSAAENLIRRQPAMCDAHVLVARLRIADGKPQLGLEELDAALQAISDRERCRRTLIELALASAQTRTADVALEKLVRSGCGSAADCLDLYTWAGAVEERRGHYPRAVVLYKRAFELRPDREDLMEQIGALGEHDGVRGEAIIAYGLLARRHPEDPRWPARAADLRRSLGAVGGPLPPL